jgi:hypothetical protein
MIELTPINAFFTNVLGNQSSHRQTKRKLTMSHAADRLHLSGKIAENAHKLNCNFFAI